MNLNQITLPASSLERSILFYRGLGLRLIVHSPSHYARFECPEGDSTLSLHQVDTATGNGAAVVYFECVDLDAKVNRLLADGFDFLQLPKDERWLWREARLNDPSNNVICLYWGGSNRKNPPWRISG